MRESRNTEIVQQAYAAFGRGDMTSLLACFDESIEWKPVTGAGPHVPFAGVRHGRSDVAEFFRIVAETETFEQFEPREFIAQGDKVVTLGHYGARTRRGGIVDSDFVMVFTLKDGQIVRFVEFLDSAALNAAFAAVAV